MDGKPDGSTDAFPVTAGGDGNGGPGTPPGTGAPGNEGGEGGGSAGLDRSKLPSFMRNMNETEIGEMVDTMVAAIANNRSGGGGGPSDQQVPRPEPPAKPDYKRLMDPQDDQYNPEAAMADFVRRNYGSVVADISDRANEGLYSQFRNEYPDFKEFESDIRRLAKEAQNQGVVVNSENIGQTYFILKGRKTAQKERQDRETARTRPPSPPVSEDRTEPPLSPGEEKIARRMFRNSPDPVKSYREYAAKVTSGQTTLKVPLSGGVRR
jgi:hypothetical protein